MRVQLIVTGDLEQIALGDSLARLFQRAGSPIEFLRSAKVNGTTSHPLPDPVLFPSSTDIPSPMRRMARRIVADATQSRVKGQAPPDLVIGVDDVELANVARPGRVVGWLKRAVLAEVEAMYPSLHAAERVRAQLRERCSFHLLCPMIEGYFFPDRAALQRAGVAAGIPVRSRNSDVEQFETDDAGFLPIARAENERKHTIERKPWWFEERHPKRYLEWLITQSGSIYEETLAGVEALKALEWSRAASTPAVTPYLRALVQDIADQFQVPSPLRAGTPSPWTYPSRAMRDGERTLRNL